MIHRDLFNLLNKHISLSQTIAFAASNVVGMLLLIAAVQFYYDVAPLFTADDGIMRPEYVVVTKQVSTVSMLTDSDQSFDNPEIEDLRSQAFVDNLGVFTPSHFAVRAIVEIPGGGQFGSEMFFESVPDRFVDVKTDSWHWDKEQKVIPIVLPRAYLNLYNFGFAQTKGLPKLSETAISMLPFRILVSRSVSYMNDEFRARIVGFSNRLNTILVPEDFLLWANEQYGDNKEHQPSRLIMKVKNPADAAIAQYFSDKGYITEQDNLEAGRMMWFLQIIVMVVLAIGVIICSLAFYLLMLSIFLLVQKNREKLRTLRLLGYSVLEVSTPYILLTATLNLLVFAIDWLAFAYIRTAYISTLSEIYPELNQATITPTILLSLTLLILLSLTNAAIIIRKITRI